MTASVFWDRLAERYATQPIKDPSAYEKTLERTRSYLKDTDRVLEVGCGTGTTALLLADAAGEVIATDYSDGMISIAERKRQEQGIRNVDFRTAPAANDYLIGDDFDAVLAFNLLHLVDNLEETLSKLNSTLKSGGFLISKTVCLKGGNPLFRFLIPVLRMIGKAPFVAFLAPRELEELMQRHGFRIVETGSYPSQRNHFVVAQKL